MQNLIPTGVADYFWEEARQRQDLAASLLDLFRRWGYGDVIPPTFEYSASLSIQAGADLQAEMYRFLDRDGSTLALRPDFTTSVARLVGSRLHDWPMPQRFCYVGSAFRYVVPRAGRQREFWQAGLELFGARGAAADGEVLALTAEAMERAGLADYRIVLGQIGYFGGLVDDLALSPAGADSLRSAIERRSEPELGDFLRKTPLGSAQRRAVEALPHLGGNHFDVVLAEARRFCLNDRMRLALENLQAIGDALAGYGVLDKVLLDLTEIRNLGYYTGISFEALTPTLGSTLASGGRYDDLVGHFGPPQPAVGVALGLDRLLLARQRQTGEPAQTVPTPPDLLVVTAGAAAALDEVRRWRAAGMRVEVEVSGRGLKDVLTYARRIGAGRVLLWSEQGFVAYRRDDDGFVREEPGESHPQRPGPEPQGTH